MASTTGVRAADGELQFSGPYALFNEVTNEVYWPSYPDNALSGTWQWQYVIDRNSAVLTGDLTLQFSPVAGGTVPEPGPVVLFWTIGGGVDASPGYYPPGWDTVFEEPMQTAARMPVCIDAGACAVQFTLTSSVRKQIAAAAQQPAADVFVDMGFTAIRTFQGGRQVQVEPPHHIAGNRHDGAGGEGYVHGTFFDYAPIEAWATANPNGAWQGDYLARVQEELLRFDERTRAPGADPRVAVWVGDRHAYRDAPDPRSLSCDALAYCGPAGQAALPGTSLPRPFPFATLGMMLLASAGALWLVTSRRRDRAPLRRG